MSADGGQHISYSHTAVHSSSRVAADMGPELPGLASVSAVLDASAGPSGAAGPVVLPDARSVATSHGAHSAADRSAAEITEYHHYTTKSETMTSAAHHQEASSHQFGWYEEEEEVRK